MRQTLIIIFCLLCRATSAQLSDVIGRPPLPWRPGELDIYQVGTGLGNAAFLILPDGTTLLVDAGAVNRDYRRRYRLTAHPDAGRSAGEWIVRFIRHVTHKQHPVIDFALLTHFHDDHVGYPDSAAPLSSTIAGMPPPFYRLSGITEVGSLLRIHHLLDRGWPDYASPLPPDSAMIMNYRRFIEVQSRINGLIPQRFIPGKKDQIRMVHDPQRYSNSFDIRNIIANGELWTAGKGIRRLFPAIDAAPNPYLYENNSSCGIRITYGRFRYFSAGDLVGKPQGAVPAWADFESSIALAVGKTTVLVAGHHASADAVNDSLLQVLQPRAIILPVWAPSHADTATRARIRRWSDKGITSCFSNAEHHILIRVAPGGNSFTVMLLENGNESLRVTCIFGAYRCK